MVYRPLASLSFPCSMDVVNPVERGLPNRTGGTADPRKSQNEQITVCPDRSMMNEMEEMEAWTRVIHLDIRSDDYSTCMVISFGHKAIAKLC
jgi:hypothetical protein